MPAPRSFDPRAAARRKTCQRFYQFKCAGEGYSSCWAEIFIEGDDLKLAERVARSEGWSLSNKEGWLCPECIKLIGSEFARYGVRKQYQRYKNPLTAHEMKVIRLRLGGKLTTEQALHAFGIDPANAGAMTSRDVRVVELNKQLKRQTETRWINLFEFGKVDGNSDVEDVIRKNKEGSF